MSTIQLTNFTGILPRYSDTLLQPNQATKANNVKLMSGEIRPWKKPVKVHQNTVVGAKTIFKLSGSGSDIWLEFADDTDICYSPLADSTGSRIYYSENGACKKTTYSMATSGASGQYPRNWYYMGTPSPVEQPVGVPGNTPTDADDTQSVVYVFTYVSVFDGIEEETAPSPASELVTTSYSNYNVAVKFKISGGSPVSPVVPTDHLNVTKLRIYRAVTGSESVIYMEVDELPLNATTHQLDASGTSLNGVVWSNYTYPDTRTSAELIKELDSLYYTPPPAGLKGLVSMPNGFMAGFKNNEVWFSEPFLPHAWPSTYMLTVDSQIIGLGVYGNTLVVCTDRQPYTISGTHPEAMTQEKQPMFQPCSSKRSIAYDQYGVVYASPYGLVALAGGQMDVFSRPIITQDEWGAFNPTSMIAVMHNNLYMCSYMKGSEPGILVFSRGDEPALVTYNLRTRAMHVERNTGTLFCLDESDDCIYEMDADAVNSETYEWVSKRFYNTYATSYSAMKVDAEFEAADRVAQWARDRTVVVAFNTAMQTERGNKGFGGTFNSFCFNEPVASGNAYRTITYVDPNTGQTGTATLIIGQTINGSMLKLVPDQVDSVFVNVAGYADGKIVFDETMTTNGAIRLPPDRGHFWQFRVIGNYNVRSIVIGTTMREVASPV